MKNQEIWRDIPNYEGLYQVSNLGRVKSLPKNVKNRYSIIYLKERILKNGHDGRGYENNKLYKNNKGKTIKTHMLVAIAFLNHKSCGMNSVIDHINSIKKDNRPENLQIITNRENCSKDRFGYSSDYIGVSWNKENKKWRAQIMINKKQKYLGLFKNEKDAHLIYQKNLKQINDSYRESTKDESVN